MAEADKDKEKQQEETADKNSKEVVLPPVKKNNLNTKSIPPLMMLVAGLISFIICYFQETEIHKFLLVVLLSMFVFAIIGTIVKTIVDNFNMNLNYEDLLDEDEYDGEIHQK